MHLSHIRSDYVEITQNIYSPAANTYERTHSTDTFVYATKCSQELTLSAVISENEQM